MGAISRACMNTRQVHQGGPWREAAKRKTWYGGDTLGYTLDTSIVLLSNGVFQGRSS